MTDPIITTARWLQSSEAHEAVEGLGEPFGLELMTIFGSAVTLDLTVLNRARPLIRARALCGIGLYERTPGALAVTQMAALGEWRDTAWLRQLDLVRLAD